MNGNKIRGIMAAMETVLLGVLCAGVLVFVLCAPYLGNQGI